MKLIERSIWTIAAAALALSIVRLASAAGPVPHHFHKESVGHGGSAGGETHACISRPTVANVACDNGSDSDDGDDSGSDDADGY
jgi:hypothetical protein